MKITKASINCFSIIKEFEGFRSEPYYCPAKVITIGFGSTRYADGTKVSMKDRSLTESEALELLKVTIVQYELAVDAYCRDDINQNQFDALVDFAYNVGVGNLKSSTLLRKVNINPKDPTIANEFNKWIHADGKIMTGLVKRRSREANLYFSKAY